MTGEELIALARVNRTGEGNVLSAGGIMHALVTGLWTAGVVLAAAAILVIKARRWLR